MNGATNATIMHDTIGVLGSGGFFRRSGGGFFSFFRRKGVVRAMYVCMYVRRWRRDLLERARIGFPTFTFSMYVCTLLYIWTDSRDSFVVGPSADF